MPFCEVCDTSVKPNELFKDLDTGTLCCEKCAEGRRIVSMPEKEDTIFGRAYDWDISYTKDAGLKASGKIGGVRVSIEADNSELSRLFTGNK